ncbi:uncharacterized protein LOC129577528 isoform X2 [Sitodiplosis mosellana]|uniref:uncharacterized protein LOC129577528 isoform X2 n=1 Tax=Sitodiplosis mosellana TaxID=263140 RepID=UPI002443FA41|nr:uncharacterized protein LOC129577528 isoform X2 [Sitodiplosis mosellana]
MNSIIFIFSISLVISVLLVNADEDGKYDARRYNQNSGKYIAMNDGRYVHVWDQRELGKYHHVHIPYTGGYGPFLNPYDHINNPYLHEVHDSDYEHVSSSSEYHPSQHPYNAQGYEIPKPDIPLVYGFPNIHYNAPLQSSPNLPVSSIPTETNLLLLDTPTTTDASSSLLDNDSTTILTGDSLNVRKKRSFIHSQPKQIEITTTGTARPRTRYDDEGKWRIIRQEEDKQDKKYDYFFETENKIFAQEAGKVDGKDKANEGTKNQGWYQYVGDDGKVYRVEYEAGEQGFIPKGDHIHKAIQKHLDSLKERNLI